MYIFEEKILTKFDQGTKTFKLHIKGKNFQIIDYTLLIIHEVKGLFAREETK